MKQVSQWSGEGSFYTLIVQELIVYIIIAQVLNTIFKMELASFRLIERILIRDQQRTCTKGGTISFQLLTRDKDT